jgi:hypothetical protein
MQQSLPNDNNTPCLICTSNCIIPIFFPVLRILAYHPNTVLRMEYEFPKQARGLKITQNIVQKTISGT